jgi:hypothetical protein
MRGKQIRMGKGSTPAAAAAAGTAATAGEAAPKREDAAPAAVKEEEPSVMIPGSPTSAADDAKSGRSGGKRTSYWTQAEKDAFVFTLRTWG